MITVNIIDICGSEVLSRANVRKLYDEVATSAMVVNFDGITFISRSVADELCNLLNQYPNLSFINMTDDVEKMFFTVKSARNSKREIPVRAKVSTTYNCTTFDDLRKVLLSPRL